MTDEWKYFITKAGYMYRYKPIYKNGYAKMETYDTYSNKWEIFDHMISLQIIEKYPEATKLDVFKHLNSNKSRG